MRISETPDGQRARQILASYAAALERIRSDAHLTPEGKKEQITAEYQGASNSLTEIKESYAHAKWGQIHVLRRDLFGSTATDPQTAISFRDAQERVGAIDPLDQEKALKLLDQAELSGDTVMVKALMQRAIELSWKQVANNYAEKHPYYGDKLKELLALQTPGGIFANRDSTENALLLYIPKPEEIDSW